MKLTELHENFIQDGRARTVLSSSPIVVKHRQVTLMPVERWVVADNKQKKTFHFRKLEQRNQFVLGLLEFEATTQHPGEMHVSELAVVLAVGTPELRQITELDKEYSKFADQLYRDVMYNQS